MKDYVSLYMQSEYSLLSSMLSLDRLSTCLDTYNYKAYAITDNSMHAAYKFYNLCKNLNIKPIIGLRLAIYNENFSNMVLLYAKNIDGYKSLLRISSMKEINKEEITKEYLAKNSKGLVCVIPVFENELNIYYQNKEYSTLNNKLREYKGIYSDIYLGISLQCEYERNNADYFIDLGLNNDIKSVAINRSCYFLDDDIEAYRILKMVRMNVKENEDSDILDDKEKELTFLNKEELELRFSKYPYLLKNCLEIEEKCNLVLDYHGYYFPKAIIDSKYSAKEYLRNLSLRGLKKRFDNYLKTDSRYNNKDLAKLYKDRLDYELAIIDKMGFNDYFLIVYDYVKYAKCNDIMVGPGRGSAGGSLVSYCLGITDVDPISFNLLFERFLNPERVGMPDIDVDFEDNLRDKIFAYLGTRYGKNKVAHITTFGTYKAKLAIRDVSRILNLSDIKLNELTKYISSNLSIDESINNSDMLKNMIRGDEDINRVVRIAKKIEGLPKNYSTHPAGIIMADTDLCDYTALQEGIDGLYQTQYEASDLEQIGLVKMDVLGLRNLSIIKNVLNILKTEENIDLDLRNIPLNDKQSYLELAKGNTLGIFQLEGSGVTNVLRNLHTSSLEDIIAATALYRPGPMEMIPSFIRRKFGQEKVEYLDPSMRNVLANTYGIIVYQEQIMLIASAFAGYTLGEADILRRAVSKKKAKVIEEEREKFVSKAVSLGRDKKQANKVYDYIEKFASYGFNRSHAVEYAIIAYQMTYLKAHYYKAFVCGLMTNCIGSINNLKAYISEARSKGVKILSPSINKSGLEFVYDKEGIYFPLVGINNLGSSLAFDLIEERNKGLFTSYNDFLSRTKNIINKKIFTYLVYSGALDEFVNNELTRKHMINHYEDDLAALDYVNLLNIKMSEEKARDEEYSFGEMSENEKEALGFNLKYNLFIKYNDLKNKYHINPFSSMLEGKEQYSIFVLKRYREIRTKNNKLMAFLTVEDESSNTMDAVLFSDAYENYRYDLKIDSVYLASLKKEIRQNDEGTKEQLVISKLKKL